MLWGVADAGTQALIVEAHHAAVAEVLDFFEREVAATRTGVAAGDGAVAQVGVAGVAATAYDHWDSRAGDPQLHTHVVISNKVETCGRALAQPRRPARCTRPSRRSSAHYNAVLADRLTRRLGVEWEHRERGADRNPAVGDRSASREELIASSRSRTREIEREKDQLIAEYVGPARPRARPPKTIVELRAQATLATRPEKRSGPSPT